MTELISEERTPECIVEEITDVPCPRTKNTVTVTAPRSLGGRKLESTSLKELKVRSWVMKMKRTSLKSKKVIIVIVKVTKTIVGAIQVDQNPRHVCLTEGVCLVAGVNTGSAAQQQRSSAADEGWRFCPRCHPAWASEGTPVGPGKDTHSTLGPE